jgi:hypothetical protein
MGRRQGLNKGIYVMNESLKMILKKLDIIIQELDLLAGGIIVGGKDNFKSSSNI